MIDPSNVPEIVPEEILARYVLHGSHIRQSNQTVKPDAFVPHPHRELSVTRHRAANQEELWRIGKAIADQIGKTLHGRADVTALVCISQRLRIVAAPVDANANHANVTDWPLDKPAQKIVAQEIAATAIFVKHK